MALQLSSKGSTDDRSGIGLTAAAPRQPDASDRSLPEPHSGSRLGWWLLAIGGALASAFAGWVIVAGVAVVGWIAAGPGHLARTVHVGTKLWLLANGATIRLGGITWSVVPLGLSLLFAYMLSRFARVAARYARRLEPALRREWQYALITSAVMTVSYAAVAVGAALSTGVAPGRCAVGAVLIAATGSLWGTCRALRVRIVDRWPDWLRPVPYAVTTAIAVLLAGGLAVLVTGIWMHASRIGDLAGGLGAGVIGGVALWLAQIAFLPNAAVWSASYAVGAGFTLGPHTVVSPTEVDLGVLPSIPVLGALPGGGVGDWSDLLWLAAGVLAGAAAAWQVLRRRPRARFDETALVGGLAGLLAGVVFVAVGWVTGGSLGDQRLSGVGPRLHELLISGGTLLGLSGMFFGLVAGLLRRRDRDEPSAG